MDDRPGEAALAREQLADAPAKLSVVHVQTTAAAQEALAAESFDAVLLGLDLLGATELSSVRAMVNASRGTPLIVLASTIDDHLRYQAVAAGAEEVLARSEVNHRLFARSVLYVIERERARSLHARIEGMLDVAPDAILVVDLAGLVRYVNRAALELFNRPREDLLGEHLGFSIRDGEPLEIMIPRQDGERTCEIRVVPFTWQGDPALLGSIRDLTELRRSQQDVLDKQRLAELRAGALRHVLDEIAGLALRCGLPDVGNATASVSNAELDPLASGETIKAALATFEAAFRGNVDANAQLTAQNRMLADAKAATEAASRELDAFSSSVAHDLRAPLRRINGFTGILLDDHHGALGHEARQHLTRIVDATHRMTQLVDDQLALARVSRAELRRVPVDVSNLARRVATRLADGVSRPSVELVVADHMVANADHRLVEILLENLLSNALKFTAQRERPRIELGAVHRDEEVVYFVRDNGVGFHPAQAQRLFQMFQRLHSAADYEGTGLGLSIVKRIVERHGGAISADSTPGEGATFYFTLAR